MIQPLSTIEIFRPGRHTATSGDRLAFSESDLRATAEAYDPAVHEAPIVVGHPKEDAPAYGWVRAISYADGLHAEPHQVDPEFAGLVTAGRYKKVSASFYRPDSAANPKPGVYYLRHVGFLGATPPALKGLKPATLATLDHAESADVVELEFGEVDGGVLRSVLRRLRDWLVETHGRETANEVVSDLEIDLIDQSARDTGPNASPSYSETTKEAGMAKETTGPESQPAPAATADPAAEAAFAERQNKLEERERAIAERETRQRREAAAQFVEGLVNDGRVLPTDKEALASFLETVEAGGQDVSFSENGTEVTKPAGTFLRAFLGRLPKAVDYSERGNAPAPSSGSYTAPTGYTVNPAKADLHGRALAYQEAHGGDYVTAVRAVEGGRQ